MKPIIGVVEWPYTDRDGDKIFENPPGIKSGTWMKSPGHLGKEKRSWGEALVPTSVKRLRRPEGGPVK